MQGVLGDFLIQVKLDTPGRDGHLTRQTQGLGMALALDVAAHRQPFLVIVVGHQTIGGSTGQIDGVDAGQNGNQRQGDQKPGPGFAVPGTSGGGMHDDSLEI